MQARRPNSTGSVKIHIDMRCITTVYCEACGATTRAKIDLCGRDTNSTMCVKTESNISEYTTSDAAKITFNFMGSTKYPGACFPECLSTEIVMRKDIIVLKNSVELSMDPTDG